MELHLAVTSWGAVNIGGLGKSDGGGWQPEVNTGCVLEQPSSLYLTKSEQQNTQVCDQKEFYSQDNNA